MKKVNQRDNGDRIITLEKETVKKTHEKLYRKYVTDSEGQNPRNTTPVLDVINELVEPMKYTIVRRTIVHSDGKKDVVEEPRYHMPSSSFATKQEQKDEKGNTVRVTERIPILVLTKKITYRKIILSPDGTEETVEENVEEPEEFAPRQAPLGEDMVVPQVVQDEESEPVIIDDIPIDSDEPKKTRRIIYKTSVIRREEQRSGVRDEEMIAPMQVDEQENIPDTFIDLPEEPKDCLLYTSPSPRDKRQSRMPSSA